MTIGAWKTYTAKELSDRVLISLFWRLNLSLKSVIRPIDIATAVKDSQTAYAALCQCKPPLNRSNLPFKAPLANIINAQKIVPRIKTALSQLKPNLLLISENQLYLYAFTPTIKRITYCEKKHNCMFIIFVSIGCTSRIKKAQTEIISIRIIAFLMSGLNFLSEEGLFPIIRRTKA
jgi:hypothetical protein